MKQLSVPPVDQVPDLGMARILLLYGAGVVAVSGMSQIPAILDDIMHSFHTGAGAAGMAMSAIFLTGATISGIGGWIIDRVGARRILLIAGCVFAISDVAAYFAPGLVWLDAARVMASIGYLGMIIAPPALIIARTTGQRRDKGMAIWSTVASTAWILGPLLSAPVAGTAAWRTTFLLHAALILIVTGLVWCFIPATTAHSTGTKATNAGSGMFAIFRQRDVLRLGIALGLSAVVGLGVNTVFPLHLKHGFATPAGTASLLLIVGPVANLAGGLLYLPLSRVLHMHALTLSSAALGLVAALLLFGAQAQLPVTIAGFALLALALGLQVSILMTRLPQIIASHHGGAANGLLSQCGSIFPAIGGPLFVLAYQSGHAAIVTACLWLAMLSVAPLSLRRMPRSGLAKEGL